MTPTHGSARGIAFICNSSGVIKQIINDEMMALKSGVPDKSFTQLVDNGSADKAMIFLSEVRTAGAAYDQIINIPVDNNIETMHFTGCMIDDDSIIIIGSLTGTDSSCFNNADDEITTDQTNTIRYALKELKQLNITAQSDEPFFNSLTQLNNDLITIQNKLTRAYSDLKRSNEDTEKHIRDLQVIHRISSTLQATIDIESLQELIISHISDAVSNADMAALLLLDKENGQVEFSAVKGFNDPSIKGTRYTAQNGYVAYVLKNRKSLFMPNMKSNPVLKPDIGLQDFYELGSAIFVPLMIDNEVFGALCVGSKNIDAFSKEDIHLLDMISATATAAIRNAELHAEVQRLAITDPLTNCYNRRGLHDLGFREVDRYKRFNRPLSAIMFDIDHFKQVNDNYGHAAGDDVLREIANICRSTLRSVDILGRYGGEEFAVLLPETDLSNAYNVAERLRIKIAETPILTQDGPVSVTVSLGVSTLDEASKSLDQLLDRTDEALYIAKNAGRNCTRCICFRKIGPELWSCMQDGRCTLQTA